jgi:hypothetical protein
MEAPHASSRTASRIDPHECDASRQADIALIHSAPTGEKFLTLRHAREERIPHRQQNKNLCRENQWPLWAFFIAASCSALAEP